MGKTTFFLLRKLSIHMVKSLKYLERKLRKDQFSSLLNCNGKDEYKEEFTM